ncbi:MAG TPA: GatB/YqeY domain-containing protein [Thermoanaerobaculia bacterium]|nr:GatB/YqeY domain-containing protein [Thermoanaerobaculia bacterium]
MSSPRETIEADLKTAMKAGEKERLGTLRMLLTEIKNDKIATGKEVDEARFAALVRKAIKQRHEAAAQFAAGGRAESAAKEQREAEILGAYLPKAVDEGELREAIRGFLTAQGLTGPAAIGPVMKEMLARFGTAADGATINRLAREELASR